MKGKTFSPNTQFKKGQKPHNYKGISYTVARKGGKRYVVIHKPDHPSANKRGYVRYHRFLVEEKIGRILSTNEIVHHIDGDTLNNNIDNLTIMNKREHDRMNVNLNVHKRWITTK